MNIYLKNLNGLRGFLCLAVMVAHYTAEKKFTDSADFLNPIFERGTHAPEFFLVISGFLLMNSFQGGGRDLTTPQYYGRRAFRIFPLLWIAVFLHNYLFKLPFDLNFFKNLFLLNGLLPYKSEDIYPLVIWSLAIEEMYYLAMPLIGRISNLLTSFLILILLFLIDAPTRLALLPALQEPPLVWRSPIFSFINLFLGIVIYHLYSEDLISATVKKKYFVPVFDIFLAGVLVSWMFGNLSDARVAMFLLVSALIGQSLFSRIIWSSRFLQYLGERCYAIYLSHWFVFTLLRLNDAKIPVRQWLQDLPLGGYQNFLAMLLSCAVALVVSEIFYQLVEKPMIKVGKNIFGKKTVPVIVAAAG